MAEPVTEQIAVHDGQCTCGALRYRLRSNPLFVHCCHCRWCQRETGTAFALNALIESDRVDVLSGMPERVPVPSQSGKGQIILRCPECRVAVWSHYAGAGETLSFVRVGTLLEPERLPPDIHIFTESKLPWVEPGGGTPVRETYYRRSASGAWKRFAGTHPPDRRPGQCERSVAPPARAGPAGLNHREKRIMLSSIALTVVLIFGAVIAVLCLLGLFAPTRLTDAVTGFWKRPAGLPAAVGVRVLLGLALILSAPQTPFPRTFVVLGIVALVAAIVILFAGRDFVQRLLDWGLRQPPALLRLWLAFGLAFGLFLLWQASETIRPCRRRPVQTSDEALMPPKRYRTIALLLITGWCSVGFATGTQAGERARDLGIPFEGVPGPLNAITDVAGVEVGHATVIHENGPARTGVTVIFPLGRAAETGVAAGHATFNGDGEMTGSRFVDEFGELHGPIALTNTLSVGTVHAAVIEWNRRNVQREDELYSRGLPLVAETWDGFLNDIYGQHVRPEHVFAALDSAAGGPVPEGNIGGGTGMSTFAFSGGIGTASRRVDSGFGTFTLGVLVQSNFGARSELRIAGKPVGQVISDHLPESGETGHNGHSIVVIVATDAPLIPTQLRRLARRATLGLGRVGSHGHSGSGDIYLAFSTGNPMNAYWGTEVNELRMLPDMDPLFAAIVQATEEAIINALVAGRTVRGRNGNAVHGLPLDRVRALFENDAEPAAP